ncbi:MAG: hypothetical protein FWG71_02670, partial [Synergistaceae bacterium]|nr:hypothetical protein [Synergistaceae bacterium]
TGSGGLTIASASGGTLTLNAVSGPAISAKGDIVINGGTVNASTQAANTPVIHSASGSVTITGNSNVTVGSAGGTGMAVRSAERSAIKAGSNITISTTGNVNATAAGSGFALEAGTVYNIIAITNGTTKLFASDDKHAFNIAPNISGNRTLVYVNGKLFWGTEGGDPGGGGGGGPSPSPSPGGGSSGGGCSAWGAGAMAFIALAMPLLIRIRRRK